MRQLASYAMESDVMSGDETTGVQAVRDIVAGWLGSKGSPSKGGDAIELRDGRLLSVERATVESATGSINDLILTEPTPNGLFRTQVSIATTGSRIAVSIGLAAASDTLAPIHLDVHCPRVVRELLGGSMLWKYRGTRITSQPQVFQGDLGADAFADLVWSQSRSVPVVVVSDEHGAVLHPGIVAALAADLAGLAIVAELDAAASWRLTARRGKSWSCYGGAIRLFWPALSSLSSPYQHPLWTSRRLLTGVADTESAAGRIRSQLRRQVLGQSAFAVAEPECFGVIRRNARSEELADLLSKAQATPDTDYKMLAEKYFLELHKARLQLDSRDEEVGDLKLQIVNLQEALRWRKQDDDLLEPESDTPPATVEEAVLAGMDRYEDALVFGADVDRGIRTVAADAGPPDKILNYFKILSEMTQARRRGALGMTAVKWLESNGAAASIESESIRNDPSAQKARTLGDGAGGVRAFDHHLKPSDRTSPDRCVRIYFEYDDTLRKTIIGWVGAHL